MDTCKHGLLPSCCEDCEQEALGVAMRVYEALERDGVYGPYSLGSALWDEFRARFGPLAQPYPEQ